MTGRRVTVTAEGSLSEHRVLHRRDEHIRCRLQGSASMRQWHLEHAIVSGGQRVRLDADLTLGVVEPVGTHCVQPGHRGAPHPGPAGRPGPQELDLRRHQLSIVVQERHVATL
jgi:hypothetical protein